MGQHAGRLQRIHELCDELTDALKTSFRIREHADELKQWDHSASRYAQNEETSRAFH